MFTVALTVTWLMTGIVVVLGWSDRHLPGRLLQWVVLWVFAVVVPTIQAMRIHWLLDDVGSPMMLPESRRALAHIRVAILICGSMTVLCVFTIVADVWRTTL